MSALDSALSELRSAVGGPLDQNDLGRLAQMHTYCHTIAEESDTLAPVAGALSLLLERLILNEVEAVDAAIDVVPHIVQVLNAMHAGEAAEPQALLDHVQALVDNRVAAPVASAPPATEAIPAQSAAPAPKIEPATESVAENDPTPAPVQSAPAPSNATSAETQPQATDSDASTPQPAGIEPYVSEPLIVDLEEREHLQGFIDESSEHMDAIESALLEVESDLTDTDKINELFRPFHTIKGIAGFLNLRDINRLTHEIETILDLGRKGEKAIEPETIDLIFNGIDVLKEQIGCLKTYIANPSGSEVPQPDIRAIMAQLQVAADVSGATTAPPTPARNADPATAPADAAPTSAAATETPEPAPSASAAPTAPPAAKSNESAQSSQGASQDTSIRVDTAKLDALVDAVGELVIAQTMVNQSAVDCEDEKLNRDVSQVTKIVRDIHETAMAMRMVPIGHTFQKMRRVVRDVSRKAGKNVELTISGEETELDKNVIQAIADPLVHMVRNAVDHGVESESDRITAGKSPQGTVELDAFYQGDSIVIEIRDDGRGLDPDKLYAKGVERGLISPEDQLTEQELFQLVLAPGFSTAAAITDISGRGVGMDVVKRNIEALRGKVEIRSELGKGSAFSIRLPLTLAIIDGMVVRVGEARIVIPTIMIEQSLRPERAQLTRVQGRGELVSIRGELIPIVQLGALFGICPPVDPTRALCVIAQTERQNIALVIDELIGQQQVVIKALGGRFRHVRGISGAAILGDGRIGLIIEPTAVFKLHVDSAAFIDYEIFDENAAAAESPAAEFDMMMEPPAEAEAHGADAELEPALVGADAGAMSLSEREAPRTQSTATPRVERSATTPARESAPPTKFEAAPKPSFDDAPKRPRSTAPKPPKRDAAPAPKRAAPAHDFDPSHFDDIGDLESF